MRKQILLNSLIFLASWGVLAQDAVKAEIGAVLDQWHQAAAKADFEAYFSLMTDDGVFIGTDAMENWQNDEFKKFSKPYFDRGRAWSFTPVQRNIYVSDNGEIAWFDELLDTRMKLCRGSGVAEKVNGQWKVAHYVLSIAVPNDKVDTLIQLKKETDSVLTLQLKKQG